MSTPPTQKPVADTIAREYAKKMIQLFGCYPEPVDVAIKSRAALILDALAAIQRGEGQVRPSALHEFNAIAQVFEDDSFSLVPPDDKPAMLAFTAGPARDAATAFESAASGKDGAK